MTPLYADENNMLEGLDDEESDNYLKENPWIVPGAYIKLVTAEKDECEPDTEAIMEHHQAQGTFDWEMEVSWRIMASPLEEVNFRTPEAPWPLSIVKDLPTLEKTAKIELLWEYKDVSALSHEDMKGMGPKFYQHQINLSIDAKKVQQQRYRMNLNYAIRIKE